VKRMNPSPRRTVHLVSLWISAFLSIIVSSSFIFNRLEADEEWMVFGEYAVFRFDFWQGLLNVGSYALWEVSTFSRLRFAYPFTEILGGSATNFIETILGIDPMLAYGVWRVVVVVAIGAIFVGLVSFLTAKASYLTRVWAIFLSAFAIPASVVAPDRLAGFRVFPSHYGLMAILGILFVIAVWWLFDKYSSTQETRIRVSTLVGLSALGLAMVLSSEFFYAIGPAVFVGRLLHILVRSENTQDTRRKDFRSLALFTGVFTTSLLAVRLVLAYFCEQSASCYSRTKVTLGPDSLGDGAFVFLGRLPFVTQIANAYGNEVEISNFLTPIVILTLVVGSFAWFLTRIGVSSHLRRSNPRELLKTGSVLGVMGAAWSFSTAFAFASTEAYVRQALGSANSEVIQLAIGSSLIFVGVGLVLIYIVLELSNRIAVRSYSAAFVTASAASAAVVFLVSAAWAINAGSAANEKEVEEILVQREVSARVVTPNALGNEASDRCDLVLRKMAAFPKSQNHEATVLWGLNLRYQKNFGMDFCSVGTINQALKDSGVKFGLSFP